MSKKDKQAWLPLAQHGGWTVEYRPDSRIVRLQMDGTVMHLEREAYQLLWGTLTEGLDELERVEDESRRLVNWGRTPDACVEWPQTRH